MLYNADRPMTLEQIQANAELNDSLVKLAQKRYAASSQYVKPWHERWVRFYKIYRAIADAVDDNDEVNFMISYAYGIVEDLVSKISEPIMQMKPPCRVAAKKSGQEQSADNFSAICASYFSTSRWQLDFTESTREQVIIGNSWENDCWAAEYSKGRIWQKVQRSTVMDKIKGFAGKMFDLPTETPYEATEEVPFDHPEKVGYHTRFPNAFDIFPEPGVKNVRDMHWLLEQERSVAIDDLLKKTFVDHVTKERKTFFNFEPLLRAAGKHEPGAIRPIPMDAKSDYGKEARDAQLGEETENSKIDQSDMDQVFLIWVWEPNRLFCIANGTHVVAYRENMFQIPRIPFRLKVYTSQKEFLYGTGCIEPIESQLYELTDIHKLSMRNWVRLINRMVAYDDEAVPYPDDFKPRAGGRIRVRPGPGGSVSSAIHTVDYPDVTQSMLAQESNTKGGIERVVAVADYAPGVDGTKQTHKTLGGLMEISKNVAQRTTTIRRMILAGFQEQMWFMEKLYSQFLMDKQPFTVYGPDGSTRLSQFDLWDIHTNGVGFDFIIEYDPSFGDDALLRNQMMVLLDAGIKYENARVQLGDGKMAKCALDEIMRRLLRGFGWMDTSRILTNPNGTVDPMAEFQIMMDGQPVAPNPEEDLVKHLIEHYIQKNSPQFRKGVMDGSIDRRVMALLDAHIQATEMMISQALQHPEALADAKIAETIKASQMRSPLPGAGGGNAEFSQGNLRNGAAAGVPVMNGPNAPTPRGVGMTEAI